MTPDVPIQDSDYDGAWKEALRRYFPEILQCYFPAVAATIDWQRPPEWYDKELSQILGQPGRRSTVDGKSVNRCDVKSEVRDQSGRQSEVRPAARGEHHERFSTLHFALCTLH